MKSDQIIDLDIVKKESIKMDELSPREKSIYDAGIDSGFGSGKTLAIVLVIALSLVFLFLIGIHNHCNHGSIWAYF